MNKIFGLLVLTSFLLVGCMHANPEQATKVSLYRGDNQGPSDALAAKLNAGKFPEDGVVFLIRAGDEIQLRLETKGNVIITELEKDIVVTAQKDMWLHASEAGILASLDGEHYSRVDQLIDGEIDVKLDLKSSERKNLMLFTLDAKIE